MGTQQHLPPLAEDADETPTAGSRPAPQPAARPALAPLTRWATPVAITALVAGAAITLAVRHGDGTSGAPARAGSAGDVGATSWPPSVQGLAAQDPGQDLTRTPEWQSSARQDVATTPVLARMYGPGGAARSIRLVAARTDLTGKLDLAWAADTGTLLGNVHCTNNLVLAEGTAPRERPTVMLCWRTSRSASAYSLIVDPTATKPVAAADGAAAVEVAWRSTHLG